MLEETDRELDVDNDKSVEYDSQAAGGLGEPSPPLGLCRRHKFDRFTCAKCADEANHGREATPSDRSKTKSRPQVGIGWRQAWYDRQAKTLEELRRRPYNGQNDVV